MQNATERSTILLVDDDETDRANLRRLFKKLQVTNLVVEADDGTVGLGLLKGDQRFRGSVALFIDLKMPLADGHEVIDVIQKDQDFARVAIVVTSGSDDPRDLARSQEMGIVGHLTKPVTQPVLLDVLDRLEAQHAIVIERAES